jgi:hypothetical protein
VNETAANIFLKTLEEPPDHLRFILIASKPEKLLPTIRSRCIPIVFRTAGVDETSKALRSIFKDTSPALIQHASATGRFGKASREIHAESLLKADDSRKAPEEPYAKLLGAFVDGLMKSNPDDFAYYLKGPLQTLLGAVEARWRLIQTLPKGLDMDGLKLFTTGELRDFAPINYLTEDEPKTLKLREYDKGRILIDDLTQELYSRLPKDGSDKPQRLVRVLHYMKTAREIGRNLDAYRNIELSFEKLLIGFNLSTTR